MSKMTIELQRNCNYIITDKINNIICRIRRKQDVKSFALIDLAKYKI